MINCKICNKLFKPISKNHKICSDLCRDEHNKQYAHNHYEKHKKEKADYYKKRWKSKEYKQSARKSRLKRKYGITLHKYDTMLKEQKGVCAICGKKETKKDRYGNIKRLQVDHDHKTGQVRGLLCFSCNSFIGQAYDNTDILKAAIKYLERV